MSLNYIHTSLCEHRCSCSWRPKQVYLTQSYCLVSTLLYRLQVVRNLVFFHSWVAFMAVLLVRDIVLWWVVYVVILATMYTCSNTKLYSYESDPQG